MADVEYQPDMQGIVSLMRSPDVHAVIMSKVRGGAAYAQAIAPRADGDYAAGIMAVDAGIGGPKRDRVVGEVWATAPHSAAVEWGNQRRPEADHVLARTLTVMEKG